MDCLPGQKSCHCTEVSVSLTVQYYIKVQRIKMAAKLSQSNFSVVMHTTFQGLKLIPGHQGERRKS